MIHKDGVFSEDGTKPLVSVVIINHNYRDFVLDAIHSIQQQTYSNIALSVIDDGSTDDSIERIETCGNIRLFKQSNQGVVHARNRALSIAEGDFLVQLDADDRLKPECIEEMVKIAVTEGADIVYCQAEYFGRVNFVSMYPSFNLEKLKHENFIVPCSLVSTRFLRTHSHISYDDYLDTLGYEDWDFFLHLCLSGAKAIRLNSPYFEYRKHDDGHSRNDEQENDLFKLLLVRHHILQKYNAEFPEEFDYFSAEIDLWLSQIQYMQSVESMRVAAQKEITDLTQRVAQKESVLESIYSSKRWRLLEALARPIRLIKHKWFNR